MLPQHNGVFRGWCGIHGDFLPLEMKYTWAESNNSRFFMKFRIVHGTEYGYMKVTKFMHQIFVVDVSIQPLQLIGMSLDAFNIFE